MTEFFDPGSSFGVQGFAPQPFVFEDVERAGLAGGPPPSAGLIEQLAGLGSFLPGIASILGPIAGIATSLFAPTGGDGPDSVLRAERNRNRDQSMRALTQLAGGSGDSGVLRATLQRFLFDEGLVGKVQIGTTAKGKPRTVQFKPDDIDALTRLGKGGVASKRGLEAFNRLTANEIVADSLTRAVGGRAFSTFQATELAPELRFSGPSQAERAAALTPFLPALPGGAIVPNVPTSGGGFFDAITDFFSGPDDSGPQPGSADFVGPVQVAEPSFTGSGPGFDFGDIVHLGKQAFGFVADNPSIVDVGMNLFGFGDRGKGGGQTAVMPGGAPIVGLGTPFPIGVNPGAITSMPSVPTTPGAGLSIQARQSQTSRLPHQVATVVPTPSGGSRVVAYRNMGRPVLWSGDFAAARRVRKVAAKAKRSRGGR